MVDWGVPYTMRHLDPRTQRVLQRIGRTTMLARTGQGLSQRNLEALTGVDQSTICRLENGEAPGLRLLKLATITAVLGIDRFDQLRPVPPPDLVARPTTVPPPDLVARPTTADPPTPDAGLTTADPPTLDARPTTADPPTLDAGLTTADPPTPDKRRATH